MREDFRRERRQPAGQRARKTVHQLRDDLAGGARRSGKAGAKGGRANSRSVHGLEHHAGARRVALSDVRRARRRFEKAEPILKELGTTIRYIGKAGEAAKVKALVNMVMNINTAGLAEGLGLGDALGLDLTMLREVFAQTGAASRVLQTDGEDMQNRDHSCFFSAAHAAKDSGIALQLARRSRARSSARARDERAIRRDDCRRFGRAR